MAKPFDVEAGKEDVTTPSGPFAVDVATLNSMNSDKDMDAFRKHGGVEGLAKALASDMHKGLDPSVQGDASIESHKVWFGENQFPQAPRKNFFYLMYENLQDPIILLLIGAAAISTGLGAGLPEERAHNAWIEGVAIWVAVFLVSGVGAANDYQKDQQFRKLNAQKDILDIKVLRGGTQCLVKNYEIVVGDIMILDTGDKVVADCVAFDTQGLVIDEASLTGESDPIKKNRDEDPWVRSGTQVSEGSGKALVIAVGINSEWGKTMALMEDAGDDETPLQLKLEDVASAVGKIGFGVAIACFLALFIKWLVENKGGNWKKVNDNGPIQFFLYAVTIIVVAVPEGLPLAVTISLAYSMKKMLKDQNFVRVLSACETMGGATAICSDKTGTLTENRMTVVQGWFSGQYYDHAPTPSELRPELVNELRMNISLNSKAFLLDKDGRVEFVGNRTECALLMLLRNWGYDYNETRSQHEADVVKLYGFTSARKMASVLVKMGDSYRVYNKGAAEWVLRRCKRVYNEYGDLVEMSDEVLEKLMNTVTDMAKVGLRCICLTYTDYPMKDPERPEDFFEDPDNVDRNLTAMCIVGIKDPVRKEVPDAVATCQRAGITVRMVTGDNIHTAQHIARECGILASTDEFIAMEGPVFRELAEKNKAELHQMLPRLRVLARSSPEDKLTLVRNLKELGHVVAVTGDGTNDAPALKESDVGLAMGIAGTEVAKEAADIIILDDNFTSIVKSVLWGRSVFANIRKFLQFQLTVNLAALCISFIGAVVGGHEPLNVLQLLWVNLIMDTMGALALATEQPTAELLDQKPHGHDESLINKKMWKHIVVQGMYQVFWMLMCLYALPKVISRYNITERGDYYSAECITKTAEYYNWDRNNATVGGTIWTCNVITRCGFPMGGETRNTNLCVLQPAWAPALVPDNLADAVCRVNSTSMTGDTCWLSDTVGNAESNLSKAYKEQNDDDWKKPLSVLFNMFIMMQVCNEINARRINDEYNVFENLHRSPIFLAVIIITLGLQAIIINFLGIFFKVVPLDWKEWLACIAVGLGAFVLSFITRWVSRNVAMPQNILSVRRMRNVPRQTSGRTSSGRTMSGNASVTRQTSGNNAAVIRQTSNNSGVTPRQSSGNKVVPM